MADDPEMTVTYSVDPSGMNAEGFACRKSAAG